MPTLFQLLSGLSKQRIEDIYKYTRIHLGKSLLKDKLIANLNIELPEKWKYIFSFFDSELAGNMDMICKYISYKKTYVIDFRNIFSNYKKVLQWTDIFLCFGLGLENGKCGVIISEEAYGVICNYDQYIRIDYFKSFEKTIALCNKYIEFYGVVEINRMYQILSETLNGFNFCCDEFNSLILYSGTFDNRYPRLENNMICGYKMDYPIVYTVKDNEYKSL